MRRRSWVGWRVSHRLRTCRAERTSHLRSSAASDPGAGSPGAGDKMKERPAAPLSFWRSNAREGLPPLRGHWPRREYGGGLSLPRRPDREPVSADSAPVLRQRSGGVSLPLDERELTRHVRLDREGGVVLARDHPQAGSDTLRVVRDMPVDRIIEYPSFRDSAEPSPTTSRSPISSPSCSTRKPRQAPTCARRAGSRTFAAWRLFC